MLKKSIEDIGETFLPKSNFSYGTYLGEKFVEAGFDFGFQVLGMTKYEDFLKNYENEKLSNNLFISSKNYSIENLDIIFYQRFEIGGVFIDIAQHFLNRIQHNFKIKDFLYIYYLFLFGNELYFYEETNFDSNSKIILSIKLNIINKLYKIKELKYIDKYLYSSRPIKTIVENNNVLLSEELEGDTYNHYKIFENNKLIKRIILSPIKIGVLDSTEHNNMKKIFSKLVPNSEYDQKEEDINESIIKTGEIFDYFIAVSKRQAKAPSNEKIKEEIFKLLKQNDISDEEIEKGISFVNNFLSSIL